MTYLTFDYARELEVDTTCSAQGGKVTVPANSKVEVHVTVTLPDAERAYLEERFPYGSYVEGFVQLLRVRRLPQPSSMCPSWPSMATTAQRPWWRNV
ncbi:MAG: Fn3-like domain-containing protein [Oscillospiraceae bacterium]